MDTWRSEGLSVQKKKAAIRYDRMRESIYLENPSIYDDSKQQMCPQVTSHLLQPFNYRGHLHNVQVDLIAMLSIYLIHLIIVSFRRKCR